MDSCAPNREGHGDGVDRAASLIGVGGAFLAAFYPLHNPDLFWHLAVGRRMAETWRPLYEEPLAALGALGRGLPWTGFEWLSELFFYMFWSKFGFIGLVFLKAAFAAATAWALDSALRRRGAAPALRALALLIWAALSQKRFMLEPELFTFLLLALLWRRLDSGRPWTRAGTLVWAALFGLWANLHGGFVYGLGLLALHSLDERLPWRKKAGRLALCAVAGVATPHGPAAYGVAFHLLGDMPRLRAGNIEWMSPALLPGTLLKAYYLLPLAGLLLLWRRARRGGGIGPGRLLILALFGLWGGLSVRSIAVAATLLVPLCAVLLCEEPRPSAALRGRPITLGALGMAAAGFLVLAAQARTLGSPWAGVAWAAHPRELTQAAARTAPGGLIYAPFDWAGYPAWRLYPERRVYAYGRLDVFHERLSSAAAARAVPERWAAFLEGEGVAAALEKTPRIMLRGLVDDPARRRSIPVRRSPFAAYYPPDRWLLAHWNDEGFLFVRRRPGGPAPWLDPSDLEYLRLAASRGWVDGRRLCREGREHRRLFGPSRYDSGLEVACAAWATGSGQAQ